MILRSFPFARVLPSIGGIRDPVGLPGGIGPVLREVAWGHPSPEKP